MALRASDVGTTQARSRAAARHATTLRTPSLSPPRATPSTTPAVGGATITELRPRSRTEALAAARRERRRWLVLGVVVFGAPFLACVGILEVVR